MSVYKKIALFLAVLAVLGGAFIINAPKAKAITVNELQAQIDALLKQLATLQAQLAEMQGTTTGWCYAFTRDLKYGVGGEEVRALQTALQKQGFYNRDITGTFDEYTASAVVGFQEKYASEILKPWGLVHGTGYVGNTTRAKLNLLYGCDQGLFSCAREITKPGVNCGGQFYGDYCENLSNGTGYFAKRKCNATKGNSCSTLVNIERTFCPNGCQDGACKSEQGITVLSPNGGEEWVAGQTYNIKWSSAGFGSAEYLFIYLAWGPVTWGTEPANRIIAESVLNDGDYQWTIPSYSTLKEMQGWEFAENEYKIRIEYGPNTTIASDYSDNYFSIVAAATACKGEGESIPVILNPPSCCAGLTLIKPKEANIVGSAGICTAKCGNGVCDTATETNYNCPSDCGTSVLPIFSFVDIDTSSAENGVSGVIYKFKIGASEKGDVAIKQFKLGMHWNDVSGNDNLELESIKLYRGSHLFTINEVALQDEDANRVSDTTGLTESSGYLILTFLSEELVPAGYEYTYTIYATPQAFGLNNTDLQGDSSTIKLMGDSSDNGDKLYLRDNNSDGIFGLSSYATGPETASNIIWSDMSALRHSGINGNSSNDWENSYLLTNLPLGGATISIFAGSGIETTCTDSDGGEDYYVKGTVKKFVNNEITKEATDSCIQIPYPDWEEPYNLIENTCRKYQYEIDNINSIYSLFYNCFYGCYDGACKLGVSLSPQTPASHEVAAGASYFPIGASSEVSHKFLSFEIDNPSSHSVSINKLAVAIEGTAKPSDFGEVIWQADGKSVDSGSNSFREVGGAGYAETPDSLYYPNGATLLTIPANSKKTIDVFAYVKSTATVGATAKFTMYANYVRAVEGFNFGGLPISGNTMTISKKSLSAEIKYQGVHNISAKAGSNLSASIIIANKSSEEIKITEAVMGDPASANNFLNHTDKNNYSIQYYDGSGTLNTAQLRDAGKNTSDGYRLFTISPGLTIPVGKEISFVVSAKLNSVVSAKEFTIIFNKFSGYGATTFSPVASVGKTTGKITIDQQTSSLKDVENSLASIYNVVSSLIDALRQGQVEK